MDSSLSRAVRSAGALRALLDAAPIGVTVVDPHDARLIDFNPRVPELLGRPPESLRGLVLTDIVLEPSRDEYLAQLADSLRSEGQVTEITYSRGDGGAIDVQAHRRPLVVEGRNLVIGYWLDVTPLHRAQRAERRLLASLDDAPVLLRRCNGVITHWTTGAQRLYGYTAREAEGRISHELLATRFEQSRGSAETALAREGRWTGELRHRRKDGEWVWVSSLWRLQDAADPTATVVEVNVDSTELHLTRESLSALNAELETRVAERTAALAEANAELNAFAYSISHDLRAPLRAMEGFAHALSEDYADALDEEARSYLAFISGGARRMDNLINDLLAYSRLSNTQLDLSRVELADIVREVIEQTAVEVTSRGGRIDAVGPFPAVIGNRPVLVQIFDNLVRNAMKFTRDALPPVIRLSAKPRGSRVRLWVEDDGLGLAAEHQDRVFNVFERIHPASRYPGTGVGLAIVRRGARRLGGDAGVESAGEGQGSRFWVDLRSAATP